MFWSPKTADAYIEQGQNHLNTGNYGRAIQDFTKAIELDQNNVQAYCMRGMTFFNAMRDYAQAIRDFSTALKLDPKGVGGYMLRGEAYRAKGDFDMAIKDFSEAIRLNPSNYNAYSERGTCYGLKECYDKEIEDYNSAIKAYDEYAKNYADTRINQAADQLNYGAAERASFIASMKSKMSGVYEDDYVDIFVNRGTAYYCNGDQEKAIADWRKALQLNPNNVNAKQKLKALNL